MIGKILNINSEDYRSIILFKKQMFLKNDYFLMTFFYFGNFYFANIKTKNSLEGAKMFFKFLGDNLFLFGAKLVCFGSLTIFPEENSFFRVQNFFLF